YDQFMPSTLGLNTPGPVQPKNTINALFRHHHAFRPFSWLPIPERMFIAFFLYTAAFSLFVQPIATKGPRPVFLLALVCVYVIAAEALCRRWPLLRKPFAYLRFGVVFAAYREMDWFTPVAKARNLENAWVVWDRSILGWLRPAIESTGVLLPGYFELCYAFVYGIGVFCVAALFLMDHDSVVDRWTSMYLAATLSTYALFPFFPSDPPRVVFPGMDTPTVTTVFRQFNLYLVGGYGIHSSVFPSAHVSSALAAGLGLLWVLPHRKAWGWGVIAYALSVAVATVYGRYHYAADAVAGIGMALAVAAIFRYWLRGAESGLDFSSMRI
ncbi:MAG: phosphatase PAP2 family protein, partial [Bryobacteraceae bacterium]